MDSQRIKALFITVIVLIAALWLGLNAATAQLETILWVSGCSTLIICAMLGRKIWMIIPLASAINLSLTLPGQPNTALLGQALFVGFCVLLFLLRRLPLRFQFTELEFWMLLLTLCVGQAYLRNPVGLNILGSGSVGARPYAIFAAALVTGVILGNLKIPAPDLRWIIRLTIIGGLINFVMMLMGHFIPQVGYWYGAGSTTTTGVDNDAEYGVNRATRIGFLGTAGRNLALWISSFKSPIRACFHPIWAPLILLTFGFAAYSGFRNEIASVGLTYLIGIAYRGGVVSVFIATVTLVMAIALLAAINIAAPLPANIQRSLSFLPGTWDEIHVQDSGNSTQWRLDMWEEALLTDFWIHNKIFGDGLGMTQQEYNYISSFDNKQAGGQAGTGKLNKQQELMMASNSYHSGPVSTIRTIGYVGLLVLLIAQIRLAVHAHRQIKRARNTEWFPLSLIIGIPIIWAPIFFVLIFGTFGDGVTAFLLGAAMVKLLKNNLPIEPPEQLA